MAALPEKTAQNAEHMNWMVQHSMPTNLATGKPNPDYDPQAEKEFNNYIPNLMGATTPTNLNELMELIKQQGGVDAVRRLQKAADLVPNLGHQYQPQALKSAFIGDNATAMMVMNPKDFEKYAAPIDDDYKKSVMKTYGIGDADTFENYDKMPKGTYQDYIDYLGQYTKPEGGGFSSVPYLQLGQEINSSFPSILGHEGRHRTAALEKLGNESTIVQMQPRAIYRESLPRRSQEDYLNALIEKIGQKPFVKPQKYLDDNGKDVRRGLIELPEMFKKGGKV